jgi:hypothetical protein
VEIYKNMEIGNFSSSWSKATVILILKHGKGHSDPNKYDQYAAQQAK